MGSIRKFAYAAVLVVSIFAVQPTLVVAEEVRGAFTLSQKVHWQNVVLPPGDYSFTVQNRGASEFLTLRGLSGMRTSAMVMVTDVDVSRPDETTRLILVSRKGMRFVSAMSLPNYDMTLRFAVPRESTEREVASK